MVNTSIKNMFVTLLLAGIILVGPFPAQAKERGPGLPRELNQLLSGWVPDTLQIKHRKRGKAIVTSVRVVKEAPLIERAFELYRFLDKRGVSGLDVFERSRKNKKEIVFSYGDRGGQPRRIILSYGAGGARYSLGILLYGLLDAEPDIVERCLTLSSEFGYVVAPDELRRACEIVGGRGEIIVMLPLTGFGGRKLSKQTNYIGLRSTKTQINKRFHFMNKPACRIHGATNPVNSIVLSNQRIVSLILRNMRKERVSFIETMPARNSVVIKTAGELGIPYVVCKNEIQGKNKKAMIGQIRRLLIIADKTGRVVSKARLSRTLMDALEESMKDLNEHGIRFRSISSLAGNDN